MAGKKIQLHVFRIPRGVNAMRSAGITAPTDLYTAQVSTNYFSSTEVGHLFDVDIGGEWTLCRIEFTYDRHRSKDLVIYAVIEERPILKIFSAGK